MCWNVGVTFVASGWGIFADEKRASCERSLQSVESVWSISFVYLVFIISSLSAGGTIIFFIYILCWMSLVGRSEMGDDCGRKVSCALSAISLPVIYLRGGWYSHRLSMFFQADLNIFWMYWVFRVPSESLKIRIWLLAIVLANMVASQMTWGFQLRIYEYTRTFCFLYFCLINIYKTNKSSPIIVRDIAVLKIIRYFPFHHSHQSVRFFRQ